MTWLVTWLVTLLVTLPGTRAEVVALPRIETRPGGVGFGWLTADGRPTTLVDLADQPGGEPHRWVPTHLEALDDTLIEVAGRFGEVLGGGRPPAREERDDLVEAHRAIDRACLEYADGHERAGLPDDPRGGQILGTAALMSIRAREAVGLIGAAPFDGELDTPAPGVVGGRAGLHWVEQEVAWRGARWLVVTGDGRRLPATLSMLLHDSSGVDRTATLDEHRTALVTVTEAVADPTADPFVACGAVDWLLFDWVMAHRESPDSGAVELRSGRAADARMLVRAAAASVRVRARFDPGLAPSPVVTR